MNFTLSEKFELIGKRGPKILQGKTVAIVGLGGLGATIAQILVRSGINLRIIDKDRITLEDVPRQTLYVAEDENKFKAKQAKKRLEEINKNVKIKSFHEELVEENLFLLDADLLVDATNDITTSLLINTYALHKGIPLVVGNYSGDHGHLLIVERSQNKKGACVGCLQKKLAQPKHSESGVYPPTSTFMAALVANAVIKNLLGYENIHSILSVDLVLTEVRHRTIEKNKDCEYCKGK
ncbi:ThiF family adenylyltransferase [Candidatus Woesearchaeota archaeon]|nr:ThiF family adenylyltransferase [Candidatus Woesearchaeota archaeon]